MANTVVLRSLGALVVNIAWREGASVCSFSRTILEKQSSTYHWAYHTPTQSQIGFLSLGSITMIAVLLSMVSGMTVINFWLRDVSLARSDQIKRGDRIQYHCSICPSTECAGSIKCRRLGKSHGEHGAEIMPRP